MRVVQGSFTVYVIKKKKKSAAFNPKHIML